jgi:hypothetical protein
MRDAGPKAEVGEHDPLPLFGRHDYPGVAEERLALPRANGVTQPHDGPLLTLEQTPQLPSFAPVGKRRLQPPEDAEARAPEADRTIEAEECVDRTDRPTERFFDALHTLSLPSADRCHAVAPLDLRQPGIEGGPVFRGCCPLGRRKISGDPERERNGAQHEQKRSNLCEHPSTMPFPSRGGIERMAGPTYAVGGWPDSVKPSWSLGV